MKRTWADGSSARKMPGSIWRSVAGSQAPGVRLAFFRGQLGAFGQRHADAGRVHEQAVLRQETGEQHAVPLLVGHFLDQRLEAIGLDAAAKLAGTGAQRVAQAPRLGGHRGEWLVAFDRQRIQCRARAGLGRRARLDDRPFEPGSQFTCQSGHNQPFRVTSR